MNQMQITTVVTGVSLAIFLAALAAVPNLIAAYLEFRAQKRGLRQQNLSELLAAQPAPVPFNYPPLYFGRVKESENQESQAAKQNIAALVNTLPGTSAFQLPANANTKCGRD
jgi:hypothetical protein